MLRSAGYTSQYFKGLIIAIIILVFVTIAVPCWLLNQLWKHNKELNEHKNLFALRFGVFYECAILECLGV